MGFAYARQYTQQRVNLLSKPPNRTSCKYILKKKYFHNSESTQKHQHSNISQAPRSKSIFKKTNKAEYVENKASI